MAPCEIRWRDGFTKIVLKGGAGSVLLSEDEYARVRDAVKAGGTFLEVRDLYGSDVLIRIPEVLLVICNSAESIRLSDADDAAEKADAMLRGDV